VIVARDCAADTSSPEVSRRYPTVASRATFACLLEWRLLLPKQQPSEILACWRRQTTWLALLDWHSLPKSAGFLFADTLPLRPGSRDQARQTELRANLHGEIRNYVPGYADGVFPLLLCLVIRTSCQITFPSFAFRRSRESSLHSLS
jgi:hypothetical protein